MIHHQVLVNIFIRYLLLLLLLHFSMSVILIINYYYYCYYYNFHYLKVLYICLDYFLFGDNSELSASCLAAVKPCQGPTGDQNSNSCWRKSGFCCDRNVQHLYKDRRNFKFPQNAHWFNNHKPENLTNVF